MSARLCSEPPVTDILRRRSLALALVLCSASVSAVPARAEAHRFAHPKNVRLGVQHDRVLLSITYDASPGDESRLLRALYDRDANGMLDEDEQQKLATYLEQNAILWIKLRIDGELAKMVRLEATSHRLTLPSNATESIGISLLYLAPLVAPIGESVMEVVLEDRDKDAASYVPTIVDLDDGFDVMFANQGELHPRTNQIQRIKLKNGAQLALRLRRSGKLGAVSPKRPT